MHSPIRSPIHPPIIPSFLHSFLDIRTTTWHDARASDCTRPVTAFRTSSQANSQCHDQLVWPRVLQKRFHTMLSFFLSFFVALINKLVDVDVGAPPVESSRTCIGADDLEVSQGIREDSYV